MMASAAFQSVPGQEIVAWAGFTNADIAPSLGRNLAGGVFGRTVFDVIEPGSAYGERLNQLDLRLTKTWRLPGTQRLELMLDVYNALNEPVRLASAAFAVSRSMPWRPIPGAEFWSSGSADNSAGDRIDASILGTGTTG